MSWFKRKNSPAEDAPGVTDDLGPDAEPDDEPILDVVPDGRHEQAPGEGRLGPDGSPIGPWDVSEREDLEGYVDLGALRLLGRSGMELRLEVEEASGRVTGATVLLEGSAVQLQAFAAPRTMGIWAEIRQEIADGVSGQGGTADELDGRFGRELLARIPVRTPDGRTGHQVARFAGVDGPRWFLRAVFSGPAAHDESAAQVLEEVVRDVVVVRGEEAMAPRELLALRLPEAAQPAGTPQDADGVPGDVQDGEPAEAARGRFDDAPDPLGSSQRIAETR